MIGKPVRIEWITQGQFAALVGVNTRTVVRWRETGYGPKAYRIGDKIKYKRLEAFAWLDDQELGPGELTAAEARIEAQAPPAEEE